MLISRETQNYYRKMCLEHTEINGYAVILNSKTATAVAGSFRASRYPKLIFPEGFNICSYIMSVCVCVKSYDYILCNMHYLDIYILKFSYDSIYDSIFTKLKTN